VSEHTRLILITGAFCALLGVILGAFGAHALKKTLSSDMLTVYNTAVQYQFYHALGILLIGVIHHHFPASSWLVASSILLLVGIILFSGSLYILALTNMPKLGIVTPFGGLCFIAGWLFFAIGIFKLPT